MATKKPVAKPAVKKPAATKTTSAPKKTAKIVRNLNNAPVHVRFKIAGSERPYFMELAPRGLNGDVHQVPVTVTETHQFVSGVGSLFEIITKTEALTIESQYPAVGYLYEPNRVQITRPADTTITTAPDWDGKGRRSPDRTGVVRREPGAQRVAGQNPGVVEATGDDLRLKPLGGERAKADDMIPDGVDVHTRRVVIERTKS